MVKTFNPIKEETGDQRGNRIVWSTESLNIAIKAIGQGRRLVSNPFYENNVKLLKENLVFQRTEQEISEWKKCRDDIIYFVNKYCKLLTPEGIQNVVLRDYQENYLRHLQKNRLSIFLACRQCGKTVTSAVFMLHYLCFNVDKNALVLGNKRKTAVEILDKLKKIFVELPFFLRPGVINWNQGQIVLDNGCMCMAEATTINSGISFTFHCVLADEFAHVPPNILDKFYNNLFPVITAGRARFMITSTQNGYNLFYRLYMAAVGKENEYAPFKVDWYQVPEWDEDTRSWYPRDDKWKAMQVGNLGSEESFNKQFGTDFDVSAKTLISRNKMQLYQRDLLEFTNKLIPGVSRSESWFWHPDYDPMELRKYFIVITCDIAEGLEQDYTVFSVYKLTDDGLECIGYFRDNEIERKEAANSLAELQCLWTDPSHTLVSIEWNTYGEIFTGHLIASSETNPLCKNYDNDTIVKYYNDSGTHWIHGFKLTPGNKTPHCVLFKEAFERNEIINQDTRFANELINFCDDGTKHFKASFGHDDLVMTAVQLEFVKKTIQYKNLREDYFQGNSPQPDTYWVPDYEGIEYGVYYDMNENTDINIHRLK